ncbi:MAG: hypothetical protein M1821_004365 [Bathelium mastoideum]|nr:MAG: hypothetical protein M1821_004365 [Bathelium mastoideum]
MPLRDLLQSLWKTKRDIMESSFQKSKTALCQLLDSDHPENAREQLVRLAPLIRASPETGSFFMTGSDFLDSLITSYSKVGAMMKSNITVVTFVALDSLLQGEKPNHSLLFDQIYSLKSTADQDKKSKPAKNTLLSDVVTNTPVLGNIESRILGPDASRAKKLVDSIKGYHNPAIKRATRPKAAHMNKGKHKAENYGESGASGGVHVHKMSLITQIQDLFPELGSGFVIQLLDEYNDDVEQVTAHLLDDSLPPSLQTADRSATLPPNPHHPTNSTDLAPDLAPRASPPPPPPPQPSALPQRHNIFDNDAFDRLSISPARLHHGRQTDPSASADALLADRRAAPAKAHILAALAAFDPDDDERDDSYDADDVGGAIDRVDEDDEADVDRGSGTRGRREGGGGGGGGGEGGGSVNEEALYRAWKAGREVFARDAGTRRGAARAALRVETGMTDEGIEGWGIMLERDAGRERRLKARFGATGGFDGRQRDVGRTAWRAGGEGDEEDSGAGTGGEDRGRGGFRGRGRGRGRGRSGGRGGNAAGPAGEQQTQVARQRKEANKGSRANHNRRDQRARKMARGGFPG